MDNNLKICFPNCTHKRRSSYTGRKFPLKDQTNQKHKQDLRYCAKRPELSCNDNYLSEFSQQLPTITGNLTILIILNMP